MAAIEASTSFCTSQANFATCRAVDRTVQRANLGFRRLHSRSLTLVNESSKRSFVPAVISAKFGRSDEKRPVETRLLSSIAALPLFLATEGNLNWKPFQDVALDVSVDQDFIKGMYLVATILFCWSTVIFASTKDPYYDSEEYRGDGGNGTQYWMYEREEEMEEELRETLVRDQLVREIEGRVGQLKEIESSQEKEVTKV